MAKHLDRNIKTSVVIMTTTFYKSVEELRFRLALETIKVVKDAGYHMVIVDGSPAEVCQQLTEATQGSNITIYSEQVRGMGPSRRQATFLATEKAREIGAKAVFWIEAEKADMIRFVPEIVKLILDGADVVVPYRTQKSLRSYPDHQIITEKEHIKFSKKFTGINLDVSFGPVMFTVDAARKFILNTSANFTKWGIADTYVIPWIVTLIARLNGVVVKSIEVDFQYPPSQKLAEEGPENDAIREKRAGQLRSSLNAHEVLGQMNIEGL